MPGFASAGVARLPWGKGADGAVPAQGAQGTGKQRASHKEASIRAFY